MLTILLFIFLLTKNVKTSKDKVSFKQYAHSVFLHYAGRSKRGDLFCAGSLILAQVVVTSAECLKQMNSTYKITAYCGSSQPSKAKAKLGVLSYEIHPQYNQDNVVYNLAVVFLGKPPPMGPYIRKIILPVGSRHKSSNDEYVVNQLKQTMVTKARLPALVQLEHDRDKSNKLASWSTRKVISGAVTEYRPELLERKHKTSSFSDEAFMGVWAKTSGLVSSNSHCKVHIVNSTCNSCYNCTNHKCSHVWCTAGIALHRCACFIVSLVVTFRRVIWKSYTHLFYYKKTCL